jgi:hypothetical protein
MALRFETGFIICDDIQCCSASHLVEWRV